MIVPFVYCTCSSWVFYYFAF